MTYSGVRQIDQAIERARASSARLADLYATSSDIASLPPDVRSGLLARIAELGRDLPETLELPARSVVDLCRRDDGGER